MTEKKIKRLHLICGIVSSCLILLAGACLILACLSIYQSGEKPFSRESVGAWFSKIQIPIYLCLAGVLGGGILSWLYPLPKATEKGVLDGQKTISRLLTRFPEAEFDVATKARLKKERGLRKLLTVVCAAVACIATILSLIYACNPDRYTLENLNGDILRSALIVLGISSVVIALFYLCKLLCDASLARELATIKEAVKSASPTKKETRENPMSSPWKAWAIRGAILLMGIVLVLLGIFNGGAEDVLGKAIRICTECIGLG
jgi:hypothetical protein